MILILCKDRWGNVLTETDATNSAHPLTTAHTYDAWGTCIATVHPDGTKQTTTVGWATEPELRYFTLTQGTAQPWVKTCDARERKVKTESRTIDTSNTLGFTYNYNSKGLLQSTVYPGNVTVGYAYDGYGNLSSVTVGNTKVWEFAGNNGLRYTATLGGTLTSVEERNSQGLLTSQQMLKGSTLLHNMGYTFNASTGNLTSRSGMLSQTETFGYDNVDRLVSIQHGSTTAMALTYGANGNITSKTGIGTYSYGTKPHAVTNVTNSGSLIDSNTQSITYTAFDKAASISQGNYRLDITYGTDLQRWKSVLKNGSTPVRTTLYAGDYEKVTENGVTKQYYYIHGGNGLAALYVKQSNASDKVYYPCTDHLGSIMKMVDANGTESFKATYDAWGQQTVTTNTLNFHRGYTGHEHLSQFALINMNGRMYDPLLGRFLSPDPFVQLPDFSQNFNRYSYCLNNPLAYTDPSGKFFVIDDLIMSAVIGATINIATQAITGNIDSFGDIFLAAGIGGVSGAIGNMAGSYIANVFNTPSFYTGLASGFTSGSIGGFISGAGNAWMSGKSLTSGLGVGFTDGIFGGLSSGLINGILSGSYAKNHGGNFLNGEGAVYVEDMIANNTDLGGDFFTNDKDLHKYLNEKGFEMADYKIANISVEDYPRDIINDNYYYRENGILIRTHKNGGIPTSLGGTRINVSQGIFKPNLHSIYLSSHPTLSSLTTVLNHELIHVYHHNLGIRKFMGKSFLNATEKAAYTYQLMNAIDKFQIQNAIDGLKKYYSPYNLTIPNWLIK